jgi:hypothetical protein
VNDQVSHPYKAIGKIIVLYVLFFKFLDSKLEHKRFCIEWQQAFPGFSLLLISSCIELCFVNVVPKLFHSFKGTIISLHVVTSSCTLTSRCVL